MPAAAPGERARTRSCARNAPLKSTRSRICAAARVGTAGVCVNSQWRRGRCGGVLGLRRAVRRERPKNHNSVQQPGKQKT